MTRLDIMTEKGQNTLLQENEAIEIFERNFPAMKYIHTPKTTIAIVDSFLIKETIIKSVVETKCRENTLSVLQGPFKNEWLITAEKIDGGASVADALQVPYVGFLYLVPDKTLLIQTLYIPAEGWIPNIYRRKTKTQYSVNGGTAYRENAFIDMSEAKIIR